MLICTVPLPASLECVGSQANAALLEARVARTRKKVSGSTLAHALSDALPFIEYDLHRQLVAKMRLHGFNAAFGLHMAVSFAGTVIVATATATCICVSALPLASKIEIGGMEKQLVSQFGSRVVALKAEVEGQSERNIAAMAAALGEDAAAPPPARERSVSETSKKRDGADDERESSTYVIDLEDKIDFEALEMLAVDECFPNVATTAPAVETQASAGEFVTLIARWRPAESSLALTRQYDSAYRTLVFRLLGAAEGAAEGASVARLRSNLNIGPSGVAYLTLSGTIALPNAAPKEAAPASAALDPVLAAAVADALSSTEATAMPITSLPTLPGGVERYFGYVSLVVVRERVSVNTQGGHIAFARALMDDALALARAQARSQGGTAIVSFMVDFLHIEERDSSAAAYGVAKVSGLACS